MLGLALSSRISLTCVSTIPHNNNNNKGFLITIYHKKMEIIWTYTKIVNCYFLVCAHFGKSSTYVYENINISLKKSKCSHNFFFIISRVFIQMPQIKLKHWICSEIWVFKQNKFYCTSKKYINIFLLWFFFIKL